MPNQSPFPLIETERLTLRELRPEDRDDLFDIFSHEEVVRYYGVAPFKTVKRAESVIKSRVNRFHKDNGIAWGLTLTGVDTLIGCCQFKSWEKRAMVSELAYELHPDHWNQGLMTETVRAALDYGFTVVGLNRIEAWASTQNVASVKVMEKCGFTHEGTQREKLYWHDQYQDMAFYGLLRREYQPS